MNWDLTYLFKTPEDFKVALEQCGSYITKVLEFKGKLNDQETFVKYLKLDLEITDKLEKIYQYASLKSDLNKKNVENASNLALVQSLFIQLSQASSWVNPEILSIGKEKVLEYVRSDEEVKQSRKKHGTNNVNNTKKNSFLGKLVFLGYVQASSFVLCFTQALKSRRNLTTE